MEIRQPFKDWLDIANRVRVETNHDNVVIVAAGVAFYAVLAILPALFLTVSVYGIFTDIDQVERHVDALLQVFPETAVRTLDLQMRNVAEEPHSTLSVGFAISVAGLAWVVSNATRALVRAIKIAYDQEEERSILEQRIVAIGLTFAIIVGLVISLAVIAAVPIWLSRLDPTHRIVTFGNLRWLFIGLGVFGGTMLLYRYAPPRRPETWREVVPGAILATVLWTASSIGFSVYVSSAANYNETYGSLGVAVVLLMWFWLSSLAVILGAELNEVLTLRREARATADASAVADAG